MAIDWIQLARDVGSIHDNGESGGTAYAQAALERIIGEENLRDAVEVAISSRPGAELTMNILRYIHSKRAAEIAYEHYKAGHKNADLAVWLIKHLAHPCSVPWIEELLADPKVAGWGVGVIDQLLWNEHVEVVDVEHLIVQAEAHEIENVREQAAFIRSYLADRSRAR
jgi:hypothetical protein